MPTSTDCINQKDCKILAHDELACSINCTQYTSEAYSKMGDNTLQGEIFISKKIARDILGMAEEIQSKSIIFENRWRLLADACLLKYPELSKDFTIH
ncbi:MAG: hypothetical protein KAU20_02370 [Nanoarchaeota archaeon]|nr:hypothetical protein [Nanoarchaeota archaeon]